MYRKSIRVVATLSLAVVALLRLTSKPVRAVHGLVGCESAGNLGPLLQLIHNVTELLFIFGASIGVLALSYAGITFMWGSEDSKRRAKQRVQRVLVGLVILLSAPLIIGFLVGQMPVCTGGP